MSIAAPNIHIAGLDDADAISKVGLASFRAAYAGTCSSEDL